MVKCTHLPIAFVSNIRNIRRNELMPLVITAFAYEMNLALLVAAATAAG
jgi:hypothetical protein